MKSLLFFFIFISFFTFAAYKEIARIEKLSQKPSAVIVDGKNNGS